MASDSPAPVGGARRALPSEDRRRTRRTLGILGLLIAIIFAGFVGTVGWVLFNAQKALDKSTDGQGGSIIQVLLPAPAPSPSDKTDSPDRYNILIAGSSFDDPKHPGGQLTDGIIVASVDLKTHETTLVSVPRDLWVEYNGSGMKINAVHVAAGTGRAGLNALSGVVERATGLHIDRRILVGFQAVEGIVDTIGGIDVTINSPDPRGINDPMVGLRLNNGTQHLDGATALLLARARNDPVPAGGEYGLPQSDYSRQQSQRMILAAIVAKVRSSGAYANPLTLVSLMQQLSDHITTDLSSVDLRSLYDATHGGGVDGFTIRGESGNILIRNYTAPGGADALAPMAGTFDYGPIQAYVKAKLSG